MTSNELGNFIADNSAQQLEPYPGLAKTFATRRTREANVWDYLNLVVDFHGPTIGQMMERLSTPENKSFLIPEALASIIRALEALDRSTDGLPKPHWAET
ncbi:MAG: hypothetical protein MN733_38100, partial [Nitrososphaera sp.]|nr:hypothetical protein [Nitrososphaera sp.]